jgi:hypothetical protein
VFEEKLPAAQAVQSLFPPLKTVKYPGAQRSHPVAPSLEVHFSGQARYVVAPTSTGADEEVFSTGYDPAGTTSQAVPPSVDMYLPAAQSEHSVEPADEIEPAAQAR